MTRRDVPRGNTHPMKNALALSVLTMLLPSCFSLPVVLNGGTGEIVLDEFPAGTELAEVTVGDGSRLRGVYVPADEPTAPIVLHLLRSTGSVTFGRDHRVLAELAELGFASLMVDYRGVGASGGSRSSANLEEDAIALYRDALRRVGGDESRLFVRAASLGTLATALILRDGARPAGISLSVPVRSETMLDNYLRPRLPWLLRLLARMPFTNPIDVDILAELRRCDTRLLVHPAREDYYLPGEEMDWMRRAVLDAGGAWHPVDGRHHDVALRSRQLFARELPFFATARGEPAQPRTPATEPAIVASIDLAQEE